MNDQRLVHVTAVQANPRLMDDPIELFAQDTKDILDAHPRTTLLVYPELHLFGDGEPDRGRTSALQASAEPLDGPRVKALAQLAEELGVWFVPGSVCERGEHGELFNTQLLFSPEGELVAHYRKIFPWRPHEPYDVGDAFVVAPTDHATFGLHICYDSWFPETTRQLAWLGAEVILNVVKTTSPDRRQELVLAQANAIVNQVFFVSCNVAGPTGEGHSLIVGPEGDILAQAKGSEPEVLTATLDLNAIRTARIEGTAGVNRPWQQFRSGDPVIPLPLYDGRIDPATWNIPLPDDASADASDASGDADDADADADAADAAKTPSGPEGQEESKA